MTHPFDELGAGLSGHQLSRLDAASELEGDQDAAREPLATPEDERYRPGLLLGLGGMGQVLSAHDERLGRQVALKRPRPGLPPGLEARLAREARITARLDHPGVVPVYDAGLGPDGRLYYTMPIVRGQSLADLLRKAEPASPRLLRRVLEACEAVGAAHRQGIVHRDLKPANLMVGEGGGTRVLDWGLARLLSDPPSEEVVGTPRYMSPEQARGAPCDPRSDVWSLGALLFEVATLRGVRSEDPSAAFAEARAETAPARRELGGLPGELGAVIERALSPDPTERYPDAAALALDLGNYLDGRRVGAHDYSARELLLRFVRTWRVPLVVAAIGLAVVAVLVVLGVTRLSAEAARAELAAAESQVAAVLAAEARDAARRDLGRSLASQAKLRRDRGSRAAAEVLAANALLHAESPSARGVVATWSVAPAPALISARPMPSCLSRHIDRGATTLACREPHALSVWDLGEEGPRLRWRLPKTFGVVAVDDDLVATVHESREIDVFDARTGQRIETFTSSCSRDLNIVGSRIFTSSTGCIQTNEVARGTESMVYPCTNHGFIGAFAIDHGVDGSGQWAALCEDGALVSGAIELEGTHEVQTPLRGPRIALALGHLESGRLAAGTADGWLVVLDKEGREVAKMPSGSAKVVELRVAGDRGLVAIGSADGTVALVEPLAGLVRQRFDEASQALGFVRDEVWLAGRELRRYRITRGTPAAFEVGSGVTSLAFAPRGGALSATSGYGVTTRSLIDGGLVGLTRPEVDFIKSGAYTADGRAFLVASSQRAQAPTWAVESWETTTWTPLPATTLEWHARRIATLADGVALLAPYLGGLLAFRPWEDGRWLWVLDGHERLADLSQAPGGHFAAAISEDVGRVLRITPVGPSAETVGYEPRGRAVAIGVDGTIVAVAGEGGLWFFDAGTSQRLDTIEVPGALFEEVALSPDMRWVAAGSRDGTAWIWRLSDRALVASFDDHDERVSALAFSPDASLFASGSWDGWVRLFDLRRLETPADELVEGIESTWKLTLSEVLSDGR